MHAKATVAIFRTAILLSFAATAIPAQTANPPFAATIAVEGPASQTGPDSYTIKAGSDLFIKVHLTNISQHKLSFGYDKDSRTNIDFSHQYEIRDSNGNLVEKRQINRSMGSTAHGWPARILKPGEGMDITGDFVSRLFDLSQMSQYTVQLSRAIPDDPKDGVVKSNTITVTVVP